VTANPLSSWSRVCRDKKHSPSIFEPGLLAASAPLSPLFTQLPGRGLLRNLGRLPIVFLPNGL
jgi:hypothetical protein